MDLIPGTLFELLGDTYFYIKKKTINIGDDWEDVYGIIKIEKGATITFISKMVENNSAEYLTFLYNNQLIGCFQQFIGSYIKKIEL